jgi:hypothetical protein
MRRPNPPTLALALLLLAPASGGAGVLLTAEEALALAFPGCTVERRTVFLTADERARAAELAGVEIASPLVHPYEASRAGAPCGTAYLDRHRVRTLAETLLIAVAPDGTLARAEVLAFDEPPDYQPRAEWYRQLDGRALDGGLELGGRVRPVTGATLTARATIDAARRALALHRVLAEGAAARLAVDDQTGAAPGGTPTPASPPP